MGRRARESVHGGKWRNTPLGKNDKTPKVRKAIAEEHKVSEGQVKAAVEIGRGLDRAAKVDPNFKNDVLSGAIKASKGDLAAIRKMGSDEEVKEAIDEIKKAKREKAKIGKCRTARSKRKAKSHF